MYYILNKYRKQLTKQEFRTLKGQIIAGDILGAEKGLKKLIERRRIKNERSKN